jgi:hypothetical protein
LPFVPMATLCHAEKFSVWIQLIQPLVNPQGAAPDSMIWREKVSISAQVAGGVSGSRPAFAKTSLL